MVFQSLIAFIRQVRLKRFAAERAQRRRIADPANQPEAVDGGLHVVRGGEVVGRDVRRGAGISRCDADATPAFRPVLIEGDLETRFRQQLTRIGVRFERHEEDLDVGIVQPLAGMGKSASQRRADRERPGAVDHIAQPGKSL